MKADDYDYQRSWATEPLFFNAPAPPNVTPLQYQLSGVEYHLARDHALFGDAPGLGKTAECILLGNAIGAKKSLVICPASLRLNWERECWRFSTIPNVSTYPVLKASDGISNRANYVIISWALLAKPEIIAAIMAERWDHVILDEAHALKDPKGNTRTKAVCAPDRIPSVAGRITAASGTILPNQPIESYNIIRLLNWEAINKASLEDFREFYYDKGGGMVRSPVFDPVRQVWSTKLHWSDEVCNQPRNLEDLQYRLRKHVMVRRLKEHVLHELPEKAWHAFPLAMTADMRRALKHPGWDEAARLYDMDPGAFDHGVPIDGAISSARKALGEAKAPAVADYIEDLLDSGIEKIIVGAWHRTVLVMLRARLSKHGLVYMDGTTSDANKQKAVDAFQTKPEVKIILGQTAVIGEGFTLTVAQDVVMAEFDWVPGRGDQLLDRSHRMGQTGSYVLGHVPVCPGTLDERILSTAIGKAVHIHAAMDKR